MPTTHDHKPRLLIRALHQSDFSAVAALSARVYGAGYSQDMVRGQLGNFPEGQFVAEYDGRIVGHCATFRIDEATAMAPHSWREITAGGYAARHDPLGDWLYGMEVCVDPDYRGLRIGRRLYDQRKKLCQSLELKGIVFVGRLPGLKRKLRQHGSVEAYVEAVESARVRDATLSFQLRNGFEAHGVIPDYLPSDAESMGYGVRLMWRNPRRAENPVVRLHQKRGTLPDSVRVATVQYQQRRIADFDAFARQVEYFVDIAADYRSDFVVFPELFTLAAAVGRQRAVVAGRFDAHADPVHRATARPAQAAGGVPTTSTSSAARIRPTSRMATSTTSATWRCAMARCTTQEKTPSHAERAPLVEDHGRRTGRGDPHRLRPDRRDDLLRLRVPRTGTAPGRPGRADVVRAVLHRRAPGLPAGALLLPGTRRREPVLRGDLGQRAATCRA